MAEFVIWWCRRDIRTEDNAALYQALKSGYPVQPVFIFDRNILDDLRDNTSILYLDKRVEFIYKELVKLNSKLSKYNASLWTYYGRPDEVWREITATYSGRLKAVYAGHDYEPYAIDRDKAVRNILAEKGVNFYTFKDQCIFEKQEVVKEDGKPYTVFTPYSKKWLQRLEQEGLQRYPSQQHLNSLLPGEPRPMPTLRDMGFEDGNTAFPPQLVPATLLSGYGTARDFPGQQGTSRAGIHLRFGTISVCNLVQQALDAGAKSYLNELIWRDFYMMILWHFPHVVSRAFKPAYDHIPWRQDEEDFRRWCVGNTGYPIVDAGMRELNATGYMHNRVRMITASFLSKHLLLDWRWGEAYFARKLLDFELSSNNGGWQWAAGTGCDAAPYFRVFNPTLQTMKFDPKLEYVRKWVPELDSLEYPKPMVDHDFARKRAIATYARALKGQ